MKIYEARVEPRGWDHRCGPRHEAQHIIESPDDCVEGRFYTTDEILKHLRGELLKAMRLFSEHYVSRNITIEELNAHWFDYVIKSDFCHEWHQGWSFHRDVANHLYKAKQDIGAMYQKTFGRLPCRDEINFAYYECWHKEEYTDFIATHDYMSSRDKSDHWDYENDGHPTHPDFEGKLAKYVKVGSCLVCGEAVEAYDEHFLCGAGEVKMSFGYGSCRDLDYASGFVHDYCSFVLDQKMTNRRLFWQNGMGGSVYPLDFEKSGKDAKDWVFDEGKSNSSDPCRAFRATADDMQCLMDDEDEEE